MRTHRFGLTTDLGRACSTLVRFIVLALLAAAPVRGQVVEEASLQGVVVVGAEERPLVGGMVLLHRVDAASAGEIDSIPSGADGSFRFTVPTVPDPGGRGDVYFASTMHQGVFYFGNPVTRAIQLDSLYRIQVFDTAAVSLDGEAPRPPELRMGVRYMLAEELEEGWQITDLMQLQIPGDRTLVEPDGGPLWRYPLPDEVRDVEVGGADREGGSAALVEGTLQLGGPLTPGPRQVIVRYVVDSLALTIPVPGGAEEMELIVREPAPALDVQGLQGTGVVEGEPGVEYRRFVAENLSSSVVTVVPGDSPVPFGWEWVAVILGLVFASAGLWAFRRGRGDGAAADGGMAMAGAGGGATPTPAQGVSGAAGGAWEGASRTDLVKRVAALDLQIADTRDSDTRDRLQATREALLARIRELS